MKKIFNLRDTPSVAKAVLVPEVERMYNAISRLAPMLMDKKPNIQDIAEKTGMTLTELRFGDWERLANYISELHKTIDDLKNEVAQRDRKMRELVIFIEETSQRLVKIYRENSLRNPND